MLKKVLAFTSSLFNVKRHRAPIEKHFDEEFVNQLPIHVFLPVLQPNLTPYCTKVLTQWLDASDDLVNARHQYGYHWDGRPSWPSYKQEWVDAVETEATSYEEMLRCVKSMPRKYTALERTMCQLIDSFRELNADIASIPDQDVVKVRKTIRAAILELAAASMH